LNGANSLHERHRTTFNSQGLVPRSSVFSKANTSSRAAKITTRCTRVQTAGHATEKQGEVLAPRRNRLADRCF